MTSEQTLSQLDPAWAWAVYRPSAETPWNPERAAHLLRRAGFGPRWQEIQQAVAAGPEESVRRALAGGPQSDSYDQQAEATIRPLLATGSTDHLPAWWLYTMLHSPHGLREKMTLFWHGHFATSAVKVRDPTLMYRQNAIFRKHALGRFQPLLAEASKDPAMLLWLDSATNHKRHPNENFAREVMELFSLGIGNYTEHDIKEAARALTGWEVRRNEFWFNEREHDVGQKTVLGRAGNWNGDDVLGILLEQPATARFLARKLFRFFVSETTDPPEQLLEPLARDFRESKYDVARLLEKMLGSNLFFSRHAIGQRVKSPVEFGVGLVRSLEGITDTYFLANDLRDLGQAVFFPPNVKGWDGGTQWINSSTLLARANLVWALVGGSHGRYARKLPLKSLAARHGITGAAATARWAADLLVSRPLPEKVYVQLTTLAGDTADGDPHLQLARVVQAVAALPEFQLN